MLFFSFFKTLQGKQIVVELKNGISIKGTLHSADQYLNFKLSEIHVIDGDQYPHLASLKSCFVRGSVIRYVHVPKDDVDVHMLQEATRREHSQTGVSS